MKFPNLKIENFLAITEAEIALADRGLVLIQGRNKADTSADSNGSGKSSIADALCWAWFGTTARGEGGDDVVNNIAGKNCRVTSTLVDGGVTYTATRHRKHTKGKNRLFLEMNDGLTTTDLTKGTDKLTQDVANKIIGSSLEVFAGSIYAGQESMPDLPAMTDKMLKTLIEEAAGVTLLGEAYATARECMAAKKIEVENAQRDLDRWAAVVDTARDDIATAHTDMNDWEVRRKHRVGERIQKIKSIMGEFGAIDKKLTEYDQSAIEKKIADIDAKIGAVKTETAQLRDLADSLFAKKSDLNNKRTAFKMAEATARDLIGQLKDVENTVGDPCTKCGRPLTENEIAAAKKSLKADIEDIKQELTELKGYVAAAQSAQEAAQKAHDDFEKSMTDVSAEQAQRKVPEDELRTIIDLTHERAAKLKEAKADKVEVEAMRAEANPYANQAEKLKKQMNEAVRKRDDTKAILSARSKELAVEEQVVRVFGPSGVRARVLDEVTPFLNTQTAKYLSVLSDGNMNANWTTLTPGSKKGELKEKFSIEVTNATGGGKFKLISGGEKRKARIATSLALQDLVATRATKPIDLFIGDEIDDALDKSGLERLMIVLDEKAKERGSVFVISHNNLQDHIRNVLTIEKTAAGKTVITEATS